MIFLFLLFLFLYSILVNIVTIINIKCFFIIVTYLHDIFLYGFALNERLI